MSPPDQPVAGRLGTGLEGSDTVCGGDGNDQIVGGTGEDEMYGRDGDVFILDANLS